MPLFLQHPHIRIKGIKGIKGIKAKGGSGLKKQPTAPFTRVLDDPEVTQTNQSARVVIHVKQSQGHSGNPAPCDKRQVEMNKRRHNCIPDMIVLTIGVQTGGWPQC